MHRSYAPYVYSDETKQNKINKRNVLIDRVRQGAPRRSRNGTTREPEVVAN